MPNMDKDPVDTLGSGVARPTGHDGGDAVAPVALVELDIPPELPVKDEGPQGEAPGTAAGEPALPPGLMELRRDLGLDGVVREEVGNLQWWSDRRGAPYVNERVLKGLSPVVRLLARGRVGLVGATGVDDTTKLNSVLIGSAVLAALLEEGDGPGEVLLGDMIAGNHLLDVAVTEKLRLGLRDHWPVDRMNQLTRLHGVLSRAVSSAAVSLARYRALRRAEHGGFEVGVRLVGQQEQVTDEQRAAH